MDNKQATMAQIRTRYGLVAGTLDERGRRTLAASEALTVGWGGIRLVSRATGLARATISMGIKEVQGTIPAPPAGRIRRPGGGRKPVVLRDPGVVDALERLAEPSSRGDPESPLRWTCKSVRALAAALWQQGHHVSHQWVAEALHHLDYRLHANRKTHEGGDRPDRDAQFAHINDTARAFLAAGDPALSVDAKKKEVRHEGALKSGGKRGFLPGQYPDLSSPPLGPLATRNRKHGGKAQEMPAITRPQARGRPKG
jgi:hypothetical protein